MLLVPSPKPEPESTEGRRRVRSLPWQTATPRQTMARPQSARATLRARRWPLPGRMLKASSAARGLWATMLSSRRYTGARGYHPLLAVAAGTGDVLMSRLREGRANTARGAAHFLRETVSRVRYGGARGQLTVRADSGFYTHALVAVCRRMDVRFSIAIRQRARLRNLIEAIPEDAWTPIPYWMDGAADVAETTYTPFQAEAETAHVSRWWPARLIPS